MKKIKFSICTVGVLLACCNYNSEEAIKKELDKTYIKISSFKKIINLLEEKQHGITSELSNTNSDLLYAAGLQIQYKEIEKNIKCYTDSLEEAELMMVSLKEKLRE